MTFQAEHLGQATFMVKVLHHNLLGLVPRQHVPEELEARLCQGCGQALQEVFLNAVGASGGTRVESHSCRH